VLFAYLEQCVPSLVADGGLRCRFEKRKVCYAYLKPDNGSTSRRRFTNLNAAINDDDAAPLNSVVHEANDVQTGEVRVKIYTSL
jgi:hypothetical protein